MAEKATLLGGSGAKVVPSWFYEEGTVSIPLPFWQGTAGNVTVSVRCQKLHKAAFIWWSNLLCCFWHLTLAATSVAVATQNGKGMDTPRLTLYVTNLTWVANSTDSLVPKNQKTEGLYLAHMTMWFFLLSFLAHFLIVACNWRQAFAQTRTERRAITPWTGWYYNHECRQPLRWVEYSFSASLMGITISVAGGVAHAYMITMIFALLWTTMVFGYYTEVTSPPLSLGPEKKPQEWLIHKDRPELLAFPAWLVPPVLQRLAPHLMGYVPYLTVWAVLGHSFFFNVSDAERGPPDFVYIIVVGQFVAFTCFGFTQLWNQIVPYGPAYYYWGEWSYLFLSMLSKGLLGLTLITSVLLYDNFDEAVMNAD